MSDCVSSKGSSPRKSDSVVGSPRKISEVGVTDVGAAGPNTTHERGTVAVPDPIPVLFTDTQNSPSSDRMACHPLAADEIHAAATTTTTSAMQSPPSISGSSSSSATENEQLTSRSSPSPMHFVPRDEDGFRTQMIVNGLAQQLGAEELRAIFAQFGPVSKALLMRDTKKNRSMGFAFVYFRYPKDAERALRLLQGFEAYGKTFILEWAVPQRQHPKPRRRRVKNDSLASAAARTPEPSGGSDTVAGDSVSQVRGQVTSPHHQVSGSSFAGIAATNVSFGDNLMHHDEPLSGGLSATGASSSAENNPLHAGGPPVNCSFSTDLSLPTSFAFAPLGNGAPE